MRCVIVFFKVKNSALYCVLLVLIIYPEQGLAFKFDICIMHRTVLRRFAQDVAKHQSAEEVC
jgi:hypothetical protein